MTVPRTPNYLLPLMLGTALTIGGAQAAADRIKGPFIGPAVQGKATVALGSMPKAVAGSKFVNIAPRVNPLANEPDHGLRGTGSPVKRQQRGVAVQTFAAPSRTVAPPPVLNFAGQGNTCGCSPPDTVGDVGPNHYVQMVNATQIAIYNKSGTILPGFPKEMNDLFASGNCAASNNGDPVVLYDSLADRWLLAQFSIGNGVCVAVSQTADPTGTYFGYEFLTPGFPDYLKFGVWPDGYYMSTNESSYAAYAFDRNSMLTGGPSIQVRFDGVTNFMLPSDLDGKTAPPAGSPNYFYTFKDDLFHGGGADRLEIHEFDVDFVTPANSTFSLTDTIPTTPFIYTVCGFFVFDCIPQGGTVQKVDPISEWPMFRFPYRNYGTHEAMAGTFTVEGTQLDTGAVYWFELRNTPGGWTLRQQGKIDSNDGVSRWIGSIAMDAVGNLALGYSASSAAIFPAIRYSVHRITDALGTMGPERTLIAGAGSQTGSNRWGDYATMSIDPTDDATFWFTSEYYTASAANDWDTRIGAFRVLNTKPFRSAGVNDGYILELSENSSTGGVLNSTASVLKFGDDNLDRQFRSFLDFDTSSLPNNAVITKAVLRLWQVGPVVGTDPFSTHGFLKGDIKAGGFSGNNALQVQDFQAFSNLPNAVIIGAPRFGNLRPTALAHIDRSGHTQFRLRHTLEDNDDLSADTHSAYSGNAPFLSTRPVLEVTYFVP